MPRAFLPTILAACAALLSGCMTSPLTPELDQIQKLYSARVDTARPVLIVGQNVSNPNSAGGVDFEVSFQNLSGKNIKYIHFLVTALNRVGDPAPSTIDGEATAKVRATGPFPNGYSGLLQWENVWYNGEIVFARIDSILVDYMDGTSESVPSARIAALELQPENNDFASPLQRTRSLSLRDGTFHLNGWHWSYQ